MLKGKYAEFYQNILDSIPREKTFTDPLRTITYGTDASFYRLRPKIVILADNERQVRRILVEANRLGLPVTFRAAGTS